MAYDSERDRLYVKQGIGDARLGIAVFDQASSLKGVLTPSRVIEPLVDGLDALGIFYLDKQADTLYVGYRFHRGPVSSGGILVFKDISTKSDSTSPDRTIEIGYHAMFAVDTRRGMLYVTPYFQTSSTLHAFDNLETANGLLSQLDSRKLILKDVDNITGLTFDMERDRLYVGSDKKGVAIVDVASDQGYLEKNASTDIKRVDTTHINLPNAHMGGASIYGSSFAYDSKNDRLYAAFDSYVYILNEVSSITSTEAGPAPIELNSLNTKTYSGFAFP
jgi:hypothetical protein